MDDQLVGRIQELVTPILTERAMELVELTCRPQGGQLRVRLLVDRVGGVTLQQCARANQLIGQALESANLIEESYTIEVSSPGLDRPLVTKRDFERAIGDDLKIILLVDNEKSREIQGMLLAVQLEAIVLKTLSGNVTIPFTQIHTAKKSVRW